jgi:superfamily II DNA or RNA helicase
MALIESKHRKTVIIFFGILFPYKESLRTLGAAMRAVLILLSAITMSNCVTSSYKKPQLVIEPYQVHQISLREHQLKPVEYLFKNSDQKGLLLDHYLGTGKTYTALAFAEKYQELPVLIVAPRFLESNWVSHIDKMGIKNKNRYTFVAYENAQSLLNKDLSKTILIVDEVHRLVERIKSKEEKIRFEYVKVYEHLRSAKKILALSGTPVFTEISDVAYLINLVSGQDLLPYNDRMFLDEFTRIKKAQSFWRGHFSESLLMMVGIPMVIASIPLAFITPTITLTAGIYLGTMGLGFSVLPIINAANPIEKIPMRRFEPGRIKDIALDYVSFYDFRDESSEDYPTQALHMRSVNYNEEQAHFMMEFADMSLGEKDLARLTRESSYNLVGNLNIESTPMQAYLRDWPDSGREIGNLAFMKDKQLVESPKFEAILNEIGQKSGVVIYSSYFENGGLLFAEFLNRKGLKDKYEVLDPNLSVPEQNRIINRYNQGKLPILILHPVYTEGLSLEGTLQLHILEPLPSQALNEQIIGRVIRFQSHHRYPKAERHVDIYNWKSTLGFALGFLENNENWGKRYSELSSISGMGAGLGRIDSNYSRKKMSPDDFTDLKRTTLKDAMKELENVFRKYSIEGNILVRN